MNELPSKTAMTRGTALSMASYGISFVIPLLVTPYVVWRLSYSTFGVWVTLSTLALWLGRGELGLGTALSRQVAERRARGDAEGLRALAATWLWFDLATGAAVVSLVAAFRGPLLAAFLPEADAAALSPVLLGFAVQAALTPFMRHLNSSLYGFQKFEAVNGLTILVTPVSMAGVVAFLELGAGLRGLVANSILFSVIQIAALAVLLRRAGCPLDPSPARFRLRDLAGLVGFGWKLEAAGVFLLVLRSDRLLLKAAGGNAALVGLYQLGAGIVERVSGMISLLSSTLLTAASDLAARGQEDRLRALFLRATKYHALAAAGLLGFAAFFAKEILVLWMGRPLPDAAAVLRLLAPAGFAVSVACPAQAIGAALGRPGLQLGASAAALGAAAFLYIAGGRRYDYVGLAGTVSVGLALGQIAYMIGFHRVMKFSWREFAGNALLRPLAAALPLAAVFAGWRALAPHLPPVETRLAAAAVVLPAFAISAGLAWAAARASRALDEYDLDVLSSLRPGKAEGRTPA